MLEWALSIARTQRIQVACKGGMAWSPPMAYVEEVTPEEPIQIPSGVSSLYCARELATSKQLLLEDTKPATAAHHDTSTMEAKMEEVHICFIKEEFPEELLHMASQQERLWRVWVAR
jgi:hypothetical protein